MALVKVNKLRCTQWNETVRCKNDCADCFLRNMSGGYPECQFLEYDGYEFIEA